MCFLVLGNFHKHYQVFRGFCQSVVEGEDLWGECAFYRLGLCLSLRNGGDPPCECTDYCLGFCLAYEREPIHQVGEAHGMGAQVISNAFQEAWTGEKIHRGGVVVIV